MASDPADLLIDARWTVPMSGRDLILEDHCIAVRDGRIIAVLPRAQALRLHRATVTVERPAHLVMPALVNSYTQAALPSHAAAQAPGEAALLSIGAMIAGGVGCFADAGPHPGETARAAAEQGVRALIGLPIAAAPSAWAADEREYFSRALSLRDEYQGHPLISTAFAPLAAATLGDDALRRVATLADETEAGVMLPLHGSHSEIETTQRSHGQRPIARLAALGLLTPALQAIHMLHVNDSDIEAAARAGIAVSLCPKSNLRRHGVAPPMSALAASGLRLALGSDAAAANNGQDLWSEIELLALLGRLPPWDCVAIATRGGAAALGLEQECGTLEVGKWADVCCVDLGGPCTVPWQTPLEQLVFGGGRDKVSDLWVAGRQLLAESRLTRLDWGGLAARLPPTKPAASKDL